MYFEEMDCPSDCDLVAIMKDDFQAKQETFIRCAIEDVTSKGAPMDTISISRVP
jgi:hypothetical protein